jgi:two-component system, LuxR family, sensor kinase FixL
LNYLSMTPASPPSSELQAVFDAAVDAVILIDHRGSVEVFSRAAERLFGYRAEEVLGKNVSILMTQKDRDLHDGYMSRYERIGVPHIIGTGREVQCRRKDGSVFAAFLSVGRVGEQVPARFVGFLQDLTLRDQALAAVVRERDHTSRYLEAMQTTLVALDTQRRVTLVNRKGCELLGCREDALIGIDWFETVVKAEDRATSAEHFAALLEHGSKDPSYTEYCIRAADGSDRLFAWRYALVREPDGSATGILCSGDDITDARRAETEARDAREQMMHVSRLATVGEMAAGISHELNQPLAAITTYAQAARRLLAATDFDDEDVTDALEQIAAQALRAGEIIRRLRSLVRNRPAQREPTQINALIEELGALTRVDARMHDVRVRLDLAPVLPELKLDPIQIQQVLLNLVRNAVQALEYQESAGREVLIKTALHGGGDVEIRICDTGSGVSEDMLARLFLPFATTKSDGTGLGLAISRSIIEAHKGTLEYMPNVPRGSCFVIRLPVGEGSNP